MTAWLDEALTKVASDATALRTLFPGVGRRVGRGPSDVPGWTVDDVARVELLKAAPGAAAEMPDLYRYGDAAEKRAVLRGLSVVDIGDAGLELVADALRTNDTRLVTAAMGSTAPRAWTTPPTATACSSASSWASPWRTSPGWTAGPTRSCCG